MPNVFLPPKGRPRVPNDPLLGPQADSDAGAEILSAGDSPASARGHEAKSADSLISPKDASSSTLAQGRWGLRPRSSERLVE